MCIFSLQNITLITSQMRHMEARQESATSLLERVQRSIAKMNATLQDKAEEDTARHNNLSQHISVVRELADDLAVNLPSRIHALGFVFATKSSLTKLDTKIHSDVSALQKDTAASADDIASLKEDIINLTMGMASADMRYAPKEDDTSTVGEETDYQEVSIA